MVKKHTSISSVLVIALLLLGANLPVEKEWTLKRTGESMWVYTRDRAGSDIKEVRLVMEVNASISEINNVLDDAERQTDWVYRCTEARDLGGTVDTGWYYYSRIDMPWPMDDRDLVAKVVGSQTKQAYKSISLAAPNHAPLVSDCVRITDFDVSTEYRWISQNKTEVTYQLHSEPGGQVPVWLVNMFIDKGPVETMTRLRTLVEE